ncbi:putative nitrate assimilation regulatory protein nirA [Sodiomyces alkalinus F11]|uniref:Putative nitrate assimilation regulatory protein nirA n=1 Tax=Sodiomyces alkalinus (strain CBS 110278 / VKM F-3762 / F11) TaxID=1314773 RepID=A0A3N2Q4B3_SODAK|nr:putative nitrate assimilation regulatory protein nirA [Sodiomyces alkalinus F11]ROT41610.1 putative nitrate assimilation regulatory protein nirA [Sodiomyces alkalinus F11]
MEEASRGVRDSTDNTTSSAIPSTAPSAPQSQTHSTPTPTPSAPPSIGPSETTSTTTSTTTNTGPAAPNPASKRRRGLGVVTPNACTECRKKRAKCDGQRPCSRCKSQKDPQCIYEIPVRQSKEDLRTELEQLRQRQRTSDQVFAALARSDAWEEILRRLRGGQSIDSISEWLGGTLPSGGGAVPSFVAAGSGTSPMGNLSPFPTAASAPSPIAIATMRLGATAVATLDPMQAQQSGIPPQNMNQSDAWHFPTSATRDTCQGDPMNWTTDLNRPPQNRVGFWGNAMNTDQSDSTYRGLDQVLGSSNVAQARAPSTTWTNITTDAFLVQHLLALYFCWEYPTFASLSKEHFLKDFQEGRPRFCSSILVNALLALGCRFSTKSSTRADPNDPYTSGDHFFKECQRLFYLEEDHHSLTTIQALGIMSIREASCGRDSESWYYAGQSIRLAIEMGLHQLQMHGGTDEDELAVQAATFWGAFALDHMYYHFAILLMFRPLIKLRIIGSKVLPRDVCFQAADAIQGLLRSHAQLYTLRRTPSFVPYFVLTSSIMHLALGASARSPQKDPGDLNLMGQPPGETQTVDPRVAKAIKQGVEDLKEMSPCHYFAEQALNILRYLAHAWNIDVDMGDDPMPPEEYTDKVRFYTSSLNFFTPNVREEDFVCIWGSDGTKESGAKREAQQHVAETAAKMGNPLFWPFPMHGRPILPSGNELAASGRPPAKAGRPSRTSAVGNIFSLPPRWLQSYDDFITKNASQVSQIESGLRSLTYVIPGRFRDAELASETIHSSVQLLSLYHDTLLMRALSRLPISRIPSPHGRYTKFWSQRSPVYRRIALLLQMVTYTQLLCEMAAKRKGGERQRWRVVVLLEAIKAFCRLLLLRITRVRPLVTPVLPEREPIPEEADENAGAELNELIGATSDDNDNDHAAEADTDAVKPHEKEWPMPRTGMSLPSLPKPDDISGYLLSKVLTADDIKPAPKLLNQAQGSAQAAEVLHILAPLVYAIALARSKNKHAWTPWLMGLSVEYVARQLRVRDFRTTPLEREEWNKRGWAMGWWAMRGAFYDRVTKGFVEGLRSRVPSLVGGILEDYEYLWENYYFSTSA